MAEKVISLAELRPDSKNARRHNPRNIGLIEKSLEQVGAARSGVVDEDNIILCGNGTYEALAAAGIERVKIVEADGNEWVVVQRKGLTEEQKRILSVSDNRSSELAEWDYLALDAQGIDLKPWFTPEELQSLKTLEVRGMEEREADEAEEREHLCPQCGYDLKKKAA